MPGFRDSERRLDRGTMRMAFEALAKRLAAREIRGHIYVVGGEAMVMAHRRSESTLDIDALAIDPRESVLDAAEEVAREQGLDPDWLNDEVRRIGVLPYRPEKTPEVLFDSPFLVVTGASARHMLAMKIRTGRARDERDIKLLLRQLGVTTMREVREIHSSVYPHDGIPWRNEARILAIIRSEREKGLGEDRDRGPKRRGRPSVPRNPAGT